MSYLSVQGQNSLTYQQPHQDILSLADVTPAPLMQMNKKATEALLIYRSAYKSIDELSEEEYRLAGLRINCLLYTSPSPRDRQKSRMPSSA